MNREQQKTPVGPSKSGTKSRSRKGRTLKASRIQSMIQRSHVPGSVKMSQQEERKLKEKHQGN